MFKPGILRHLRQSCYKAAFLLIRGNKLPDPPRHVSSVSFATPLRARVPASSSYSIDMTIPPPSASDATASPASLKRESNICQSPPQNTSYVPVDCRYSRSPLTYRHHRDRKSPHSVNDAPVRHGSTVLSTRVDWDLHEDDSECVYVVLVSFISDMHFSDDRMSENELDEQHRVTNSGISSDGEDTALSE